VWYFIQIKSIIKKSLHEDTHIKKFIASNEKGSSMRNAIIVLALKIEILLNLNSAGKESTCRFTSRSKTKIFEWKIKSSPKVCMTNLMN
jgi:hypothetical protein